MFDLSKMAQAAVINFSSPEWMQAGKRAWQLHMAAPVFIPGSTSTEELAERVKQAGKPN